MLQRVLNRIMLPFGFYLQKTTDRTIASLFTRALSANAPGIRSQLGQDAMVDLLLSKRNGFFVEFGALDGVRFSNTYFLEYQREWTGILAEPSRSCLKTLKENRPNAIVDTRCVWSTSGHSLKFIETNDNEYSTIADYAETDHHHVQRKLETSKYEVETVSLNDLLRDHQCPNEFDFLSIDTEGSEFEILATLNLQLHRPRIIAVEHNYSAIRQQIFSLLTRNGYVRIIPECSWWDDWYVDTKILVASLQRLHSGDR